MKVFLLFYATLALNGAFEYRTGSPDSLFPVQTAIHDYSTPVIMMSPALLPFTDGFTLNSSAGRPYSEGELVYASSAVQYGSGDYGLQFSWNMFGAEFYREHTLSLKTGYALFPFLNAGISENIYILKIESDQIPQRIKISGTDFALLFSPFQWINAAFIQTGLLTLLNGHDSDIIFPERSAGILLKPGRGFSATWNITETAAGRVNTFAVSINPTSFISMRGGYCRESSSFAASAGILADKFFVTYGLNYHPYLGYTHSLGVTFALHPVIESLNYGRPQISSGCRRVNIQRATSDELKNTAGLSDRSAGRIVLYRQKIGPVTEKALIQIGVSVEEISAMEDKIYGLERTPRNKNGEKKFVKKPPRKERIRSKFRSLIAAGISARIAITYSELSESGTIDDFHNRLHNDTSLNDQQKKSIERICYE